MKQLFDWQKDIVDAAEPHDGVFLAWEMALGKTISSVVLANRWQTNGVGNRVVVVLPANTRTSWKREILDQDPDANVFYMDTSNKQNLLAFGALKKGSPGWYLISWEMMRSGALTGQPNIDILIADETHRQSNTKSLQSRMIKDLKAKKRIALSGTPGGNKPEGLYSTMVFLWFEKYKSYWQWVDDFWLTRRNGAVIDFVREKVPGSVVADMPFFSRELMRDHRTDMPDVEPEIDVFVGLTPTQRKIYNKLEAEAGVWVDDSFIEAGYPLVQDMRLREICLGVPMVDDEWKVTFDVKTKSSKMTELLDIMSDYDQKTDTWLILTHSKKFVPVVVAQLKAKGYTAAGFTGDNNQSERDWMLENFGKKFNVLVASIAAIAEGTDGLQYVCHKQVWLSKHANWYLNVQGAQRLDRPGQKYPVRSWYIQADDTIDQRNTERLQEITGNLENVIDFRAE